MADFLYSNTTDISIVESSTAIENHTSSIILLSNISDVLNKTMSTTKGSTQSEQLDIVKHNLAITNYTLFPFLLLMGIFGNVLTIGILSRNKITSMASRYILILLSICDMTMIIMHTFNKKSIPPLIGFDIRALSVVGCKTFFHIYRTTKCMSSWLIVLLCLERFIVVIFPLKAKLIITQRRVVTILILLAIFLVAFNSTWTFSIDVVKSKKKTECKQNVELEDDRVIYDVFLVLYNAIFSWIPICIMSTLTPVIIYKITKQMKKREALSSAVNAGTETARISAMLVGVVIAYVIFILPVTIFHIHKSFLNLGIEKNGVDFFIFREVVQYLEMMNYSTNFIMYTFGSVTYRKKVQALFCRCCMDKEPESLVRSASTRMRISSERSRIPSEKNEI